MQELASAWKDVEKPGVLGGEINRGLPGGRAGAGDAREAQTGPCLCLPVSLGQSWS